MSKRLCGECRACCTILRVPDVPTEAQERCQHECATGCSVYMVRPQPCRDFECLWLQGWGTRDQRPDRLKVMLDARTEVDLARQAGSQNPHIVVFRPLGSVKHLLEEPVQALRILLVARGLAVIEDRGRGFLQMFGPVLPPDGIPLDRDVKGGQ